MCASQKQATTDRHHQPLFWTRWLARKVAKTLAPVKDFDSGPPPPKYGEDCILSHSHGNKGLSSMNCSAPTHMCAPQPHTHTHKGT